MNLPIHNMRILYCVCFAIFIFSWTLPVCAQEDVENFINQVQINSQRSYDYINTVTFKAHSKMYLYFGFNPLRIKLIPYLEEYYLDGTWIKPDSLRLNVKALKKIVPDSANISSDDINLEDINKQLPLPNPFQFTYDPSVIASKRARNKMNDDVYVWPLYPFALGADSLYNYEIVGEVSSNYMTVVEVKVAPKDPMVPGVIGTFQIDKNKCVVVGSDYIFNEAAGFVDADEERLDVSVFFTIRFGENHHVKTRKALLYTTLWLPETIEEEFDFSLLGFRLKVHRILEFESYDVNPAEPQEESIVNKRIVYNRDPVLEDSVFVKPPHPNRLTREEEEEIIQKIEDKFAVKDLFKELIDSESIAKEALIQGLEQIGESYFRIAQRAGSYSQYNRVEGLRLEYGTTLPGLVFKNSAMSLKGGYGFEDEKWKGEAAYLYYIDKKKKLFVEGNLYNTAGFEESRSVVSTRKNTFTSLLLKRDYRDYYYKKGGSLSIGYRIADNLAFKLTGVSQTEESAYNKAKFSIFKNKEEFRLNPEIIDGVFRGLRGSILYRTYHIDADVAAEYTNNNTFHSDYSYTRVSGKMRLSYRPTFYTNLYLSLAGGISDGDLPPQRWFDFGGKMLLDFYGNLRGVGYKAFTGDRMAYGTLEYVVNGNVLYNLGLKRTYLKIMKFTFWSGAGWSELSDRNIRYAAGVNAPTRTTDDIYYEFGIGIGDKLNIFRVDFIYNSISKNKILIGFNFLR